MIGNDTLPLVRRANEASARLDKAAANPENPFEMIRARREAESVVAELAKVANDDRALALFKAAQSQPRALYDERPGAAPSLTQSSNISSSPRGTRVPVAPSAGSIAPLKTFPQSDNYSAEERRTAALNGQAMPDGSHVIKNSADLATSFVSWSQSGKPEGALKEHIRTRAHAIGAEGMLPESDFRATAKLALGALRKN
jgi:hypothetical protein